MHRRRGWFVNAGESAASAIGKAWRAHAARDTTLIGVVLDVAACALLSIAAGMLALPAGVAVAGIGCFFLNWRLAGE